MWLSSWVVKSFFCTQRTDPAKYVQPCRLHGRETRFCSVILRPADVEKLEESPIVHQCECSFLYSDDASDGGAANLMAPRHGPVASNIVLFINVFYISSLHGTTSRLSSARVQVMLLPTRAFLRRRERALRLLCQGSQTGASFSAIFCAISRTTSRRAS